jgi:hypothetical protein
VNELAMTEQGSSDMISEWPRLRHIRQYFFVIVFSRNRRSILRMRQALLDIHTKHAPNTTNSIPAFHYPEAVCTVPFSKSSPSSLSRPKLINPFPVLPLPILIAHLQRATKSLISFDSASLSDVTRSCMRNEEAIAKFARDPAIRQ